MALPHSYEAVRSLKYLPRAEELHLVHVLDVPSPAYPMMMPEVAQELYETVERNMRDDGTVSVGSHRVLAPVRCWAGYEASGRWISGRATRGLG